MLRFIGRRLLVAIPTLFLVVTLAFFMMRAAPGSPFAPLAGAAAVVVSLAFAAGRLRRPPLA